MSSTRATASLCFSLLTRQHQTALAHFRLVIINQLIIRQPQWPLWTCAFLAASTTSSSVALNRPDLMLCSSSEWNNRVSCGRAPERLELELVICPIGDDRARHKLVQAEQEPEHGGLTIDRESDKRVLARGDHEREGVEEQAGVGVADAVEHDCATGSA